MNRETPEHAFYTSPGAFGYLRFPPLVHSSRWNYGWRTCCRALRSCHTGQGQAGLCPGRPHRLPHSGSGSCWNVVNAARPLKLTATPWRRPAWGTCLAKPTRVLLRFFSRATGAPSRVIRICRAIPSAPSCLSLCSSSTVPTSTTSAGLSMSPAFSGAPSFPVVTGKSGSSSTSSSAGPICAPINPRSGCSSRQISTPEAPGAWLSRPWQVSTPIRDPPHWASGNRRRRPRHWTRSAHRYVPGWPGTCWPRAG